MEVLRKPKYVVWCVATFVGMFGYLIPIVNIVRDGLAEFALGFDKRLLIVFKDHHSIHAFPDNNPVYVNILFSASAGVSGMVFGKIGDYTVGISGFYELLQNKPDYHEYYLRFSQKFEGSNFEK